MQNHWKESSNVILLKPSKSSSTDYDYEVLTIEGNEGPQKASYGLPGGTLHASDFSSKWLKLLNSFGVNCNSIDSSMGSPSNRPPIIADNLLLDDLKRSSSNEEDFVTTDMALKICVIRHVFRQTGILLVKAMTEMTISWEDISIWRQRVDKSPEQFIDLCHHFHLTPDLWALKEWWNWLTPTSVGRCPRFDTIYYICCVHNLIEYDCHGLQTTQPSQHRWFSPQKLLQDRQTKGYSLPPPQIYELSRLLNFSSIHTINEFAINREKHGIQRWLPVLVMYSDGTVTLLPGDDYYPENVELFATKPVRSFSQTLKSMRLKAFKLNRMELRGYECNVVVDNYDMPSKHVKPLNYDLNFQFVTNKL